MDLKYLLFFILFSSINISCSKENKNILNVEYNLGENGIINIEASANAAVNYRFSFNNNTVIENTTGQVEYQYLNKGVFTIGIWAFFDSANQDYSYTTIEVEITNAEGSTLSNEGNIDTSETVTAYSNYSLVWNDEFNYEGAPSDAKWHHQYIPLFGGGWANNEEQHYTARLDNSYVSDGTLKIVAKRESYSYNGSRKNYTSARLNSKFDIQYGRIDVRAKLPQRAGTWPAIWTLGTNINETGNYHGNSAGSVGWPACGEIDIMEQNGWDKNLVQGYFHWADTSSSEYQSYGEVKSTQDLGVGSLTNDFHLYSLVWNTNSMLIYVDEILVVSMSNNGNNPFDNPHYLLLNIAMGGTLGGNIPDSFTQDIMEIDYVRFYQ